MEQLLWYLLAGTRGGLNRIRILDLILERPRNAHQLALDLKLDYRTVRHHLNQLTRNGLLTQRSGGPYGMPYFPTGGLQHYRATYERIRASVVAVPRGPILANRDVLPIG